MCLQRDSKNVKKITYGTSQMMSPNDFLSQVCHKYYSQLLDKQQYIDISPYHDTSSQ